jgi:hypothetical protein
MLAAANVPVFENVAQLEQLPPGRLLRDGTADEDPRRERRPGTDRDAGAIASGPWSARGLGKKESDPESAEE